MCWIAGAVTSALEWTRMVWPSASALAAALTPMAPPPPGRFSMKDGLTDVGRDLLEYHSRKQVGGAPGSERHDDLDPLGRPAFGH
jgi:hypothetical protein